MGAAGRAPRGMLVVRACTDVVLQLALHPLLLLAFGGEAVVSFLRGRPHGLTPLYDAHLRQYWIRTSSPVLDTRRGIVLWTTLASLDMATDLAFAANVLASHRAGVAAKVILGLLSILSALFSIGYLAYALRTYLKIRERLDLQGLNSFMYLKIGVDDLPHVAMATIALAYGANNRPSISVLKLVIAAFTALTGLVFTRYRFLAQGDGLDPSIMRDHYGSRRGRDGGLTEAGLHEHLLPTGADPLPGPPPPLDLDGEYDEVVYSGGPLEGTYSDVRAMGLPPGAALGGADAGYMDVHTAEARRAESAYLQLSDDTEVGGEVPYTEFRGDMDPYVSLDPPTAVARAEAPYTEIGDLPRSNTLSAQQDSAPFWMSAPAYQALPPSRRQAFDQGMNYFLYFDGDGDGAMQLGEFRKLYTDLVKYGNYDINESPEALFETIDMQLTGSISSVMFMDWLAERV